MFYSNFELLFPNGLTLKCNFEQLKVFFALFVKTIHFFYSIKFFIKVDILFLKSLNTKLKKFEARKKRRRWQAGEELYEAALLSGRAKQKFITLDKLFSLACERRMLMVCKQRYFGKEIAILKQVLDVCMTIS